MADGTHYLWAPDVVRGKDGRYYLYYCPDDSIRSIGVAVCDTPAGKYEFLGIVQDEKGNAIGEREGDAIAFDPGVFLDQDGSIYLYSGNGPRKEEDIGKDPRGSRVMTLKDDMLTIKTEPEKLLPTLGEAQGTGFEGHEFFEASSIRKFNGHYYLVYSSVKLHELCYAVSDYPDRDFAYGGVLVSNADMPGKTQNGQTEGRPMEGMQTESMQAENGQIENVKAENCRPKNCFGNNHGGIECINGQYYVFYHRQTNRTMFSRQGCAEKITILPDGSIPQAEMTSCGLNPGALKGSGTYPASIACHLYGRYTPVTSNLKAMEDRHPYLTQDGEDYDPAQEDRIPPRQYITNGEDGMTVLFRYFDIRNVGHIAIKVRGSMEGRVLISTSEERESLGEIGISPSAQWKEFSAEVRLPAGKQAICFRFRGSGKTDFLEFTLQD